MRPEDCSIGQRVRINKPGDAMLHGETGVICDIEEWGTVCVRFDHYTAKFDEYDDTRKGNVTVECEEVELR